VQDILQRRQRVEAVLHNPAARLLATEDDLFYKALCFASVAQAQHDTRRDFTVFCDKMHMMLHYYCAKHGGWNICCCLGEANILCPENAAVLPLWRAWVLLDIDTGAMRFDKENIAFTLRPGVLDKMLVRRIEAGEALREDRAPEDFFAPGYKPFYYRSDSTAIENDAIRLFKAYTPTLFRIPEVLFSS